MNAIISMYAPDVDTWIKKTKYLSPDRNKTSSD